MVYTVTKYQGQQKKILKTNVKMLWISFFHPKKIYRQDINFEGISLILAFVN